MRIMKISACIPFGFLHAVLKMNEQQFQSTTTHVAHCDVEHKDCAIPLSRGVGEGVSFEKCYLINADGTHTVFIYD